MITYLFKGILELEDCLAHNKNKTQAKKLNKQNPFLISKFNHLTAYLRRPQYYISKSNINYLISKIKSKDKINIDFADSNSTFINEVKKINIKIDIGFRFSSQLILSNLVNKALISKASPFNLSNFKWVSSIGVIVHLPFDSVEKNNEVKTYKNREILHIDLHEKFGIKGSRIIWMPYTDYLFPGIVTKNIFSRLLGHFLRGKLGLKILLNSKNICLKKNFIAGEWVEWNDTFQHTGALNKSKEIVIAYVIRFSRKYNEDTFLPIKEILDFSRKYFDQSSINRNDALVDTAKYIFNKIINLSEKIFSINVDCKFEINLWDNLNIELNDQEKRIILYILDHSIREFRDRCASFPLIIESRVSDQNIKNKFINNLDLFLQEIKKEKAFLLVS